MQTKNGKLPVKAKAQARPAALNLDDIFGNQLGIEPSMKKLIESKGLAMRFISAAKLASNAGYHSRAWQPLPLKQLKEWGHDTMGLGNFLNGTDPEGYVRRGDLVLAVRPMEVHNKHKAYLKQEAERASRPLRKQAEELRDFVKDHNLDATVHEGFEDNEM